MARQTTKKRGKIFVISAPSGGGKTTLAKALLKSLSNTVRSISMTTREPRKDEIKGRDYYFVSKEAFLSVKRKGGFFESAKVFDQYYGTPKDPVNNLLNKGKDVLLLIDVQGAKQVRKQAKDAVLIFILPPSLPTLKKRLMRRSTDSVVQINKRLSVAKEELKEADKYDYQIVNKKLDVATDELKAIVIAERLRTQ